MTHQRRSLAERRAYETQHNPPKEPPMETTDELACMTCEDTGEYNTPAGTPMPCPDCELGEWNDTLETWDDARKGK